MGWLVLRGTGGKQHGRFWVPRRRRQVDHQLGPGSPSPTLAATYLRKMGLRNPVVLLAGSAGIHELETARDLDVASYVVKPIGFRALSEVVRRLDQPWALLRETAKE